MMTNTEYWRDLMNKKCSYLSWEWKWWKGAGLDTLVFGHPFKGGCVSLIFRDNEPFAVNGYSTITAKELCAGGWEEPMCLGERGKFLALIALEAGRKLALSGSIS
jgi:hypothetical protein